MSIKAKLMASISAFLLILGLIIFGVFAASSQSISMNGNVQFVVKDKSLFVKEVRMQAVGSDADVVDFTPGYINGDFDLDLSGYTSSHTNNRGSFIIYFDIINTTTTAYNVSVDYTGLSNIEGLEVTVSSQIPAGSEVISNIEETTPITTTLMLTVVNPNLATIDLSQIIINIEEYVAEVLEDFIFDDNGNLLRYLGTDTTVEIPSSYSMVGTPTEVTKSFDSQDNLLADENLFMFLQSADFTVRYNSEEHVYENFPDLFYDVMMASSVSFPCEMTYYDYSNVTFTTGSDIQVNDVKMAFAASTVQEVVLPKGMKSIGSCAFYGTLITSIEIPASVETIGNMAFYGTASLTTVTFAENSILQVIGEGAFSASAITNITIPESVTSIAGMAFYTSPDETINIIFNTPYDWQVSEDGSFATDTTTTLSASDVVANASEYLTHTYPYYWRAVV